MNSEIKGKLITPEIVFKIQANIEYKLNEAYKKKIVDRKYTCEIVQCKKDPCHLHIGIGEHVICDCIERSIYVN